MTSFDGSKSLLRSSPVWFLPDRLKVSVPVFDTCPFLKPLRLYHEKQQTTDQFSPMIISNPMLQSGYQKHII